jgi:cytoskeletal protein CcmA (bactofilin family)
MEQGNPWVLSVSPDKMQAQLCISGDDTVDIKELLGALSDAGICYGIKEDAIAHALQNPGTTVLAAEGTQAVDGTADSLTFHIAERLLTGENVIGIADDLYRTFKVPSVEVNERLATRVPGIPGIEGTDIYGKPVKPPVQPVIYVRVASGVQLSDDGNTVLATIVGRPRMEKDGKTYRFQVLPYFTHTGDLTIEAGHVSFQGDVTVLGNVTEGVSITASGTVEILGNAIGAKIEAGENIHIRGNVIQSRLRAGAGKMIWVELGPLVDDIILELFELSGVFEQLESRGQLGKKPFAQTAAQVVSLRFPRYAEAVAKVTALAQAHEKAPVNTGASDLKTQIQLYHPENWTSPEHLQLLISNAAQLREHGKASMQGGDIFLSYTLNAGVHAAGQIVIRGQGSMHSLLEAGKEIQIHGKLRGGSVQAPNSIYVKETGSAAGASTVLRVGSRGMIELDKTFENTLLFIGKSSLKITDTVGRSRASLNQDGRVELTGRH